MASYFVSKYFTVLYFCSFKISLHDDIIMWPLIGVYSLVCSDLLLHD